MNRKDGITTIFYDLEFTQLIQDTTIISIGLITDKGDKFYAELTDYNILLVNTWIKNNVLDNLWINTMKEEDYPEYYHTGTKLEIGNKLKKWLSRFDKIEWVSDVCHYDFVLLIDLVYKEAMNMPYGRHCAACHDINQDISDFYKISEIEAFDMNREAIIENIELDIDIKETKHNALWDALVIKKIYEIIR